MKTIRFDLVSERVGSASNPKMLEISVLGRTIFESLES